MIKIAGEDAKQLVHLYLLVNMPNGITVLEKRMMVSYKINCILTI